MGDQGRNVPVEPGSGSAEFPRRKDPDVGIDESLKEWRAKLNKMRVADREEEDVATEAPERQTPPVKTPEPTVPKRKPRKPRTAKRTTSKPRPDRVIDLRDPRPRRKRRKRRWLRYVAALVVLLLIALVADAAYVGLGLRSRLLSARASLTDGRDAFARGDYNMALEQFSEALAEAGSARDLRTRPGAVALRVAPFTSPDARTAEALTDVTELISQAGLNAIDMYDRLGVASLGLAGALFQSGHFRLQSMEEARTGVVGVMELLSRADRLLSEDLHPNVAVIDEALDTARSQVTEALTALTRADLLLGAAPALLGGGGKRGYLFLLQDPGQSRATGGVIRYYGVLEATEGNLELGKIRPIGKLARGPGGVHSINLSPDFPDVARALLAYYQFETGRKLDGVIATDPVALEQISEATGPVREEGYEVAVSEDNAAKVIMHDAIEHFDDRPEALNRYVAGVVEKSWNAVTEGVGDPVVLMDALDYSARSQHFKMYSTSQQAQRALDDLRVSGDPRMFGPNAQLVAQNSRIASQVNFFVRRRLDVRIQLLEDGTADVVTTVKIDNRAPEGPPSAVLGNHHPGLARLSLEAVLPDTAQNVSGDDEGDITFESSIVAERPALSIDMEVPPESHRKTSFSYDMTFPALADGGSLRFVMAPAALAFPDHAVVEVRAPSGYCFAPCLQESSERWVKQGTLDTPWYITLKPVPQSD